MLNYMSWTVYEHITPSGKRYIGITSKKPEKRWRNGEGYHKDKPFGCAIEKYGWENIQHNIVSTDLTEKEAKWLENYLICYYRTFVGFKDDCKGYNCTLGGDGTVGITSSWKGKHHTDETKRKQSEAHKGEKNPQYGKHPTEETILKRRASLKGKTSWNKGKTTPEETRRKQSEANKGIIPWNKGIPAWNKGIPQSEDAKRKNSEAHKGKTSPNKDKPMSEEQKNKISEKNKGKHRVYHEDGTFHMER